MAGHSQECREDRCVVIFEPFFVLRVAGDLASGGSQDSFHACSYSHFHFAQAIVCRPVTR